MQRERVVKRIYLNPQLRVTQDIQQTPMFLCRNSSTEEYKEEYCSRIYTANFDLYRTSVLYSNFAIRIPSWLVKSADS